jgi:6-phosphogluconolactonase (cycloisomerase 2 family)
MKLSWFGRLALALFASLALGLGMSACGGGTIAYLWVLGQQYNQIASFKVDDFTGNLTQTPHQPFAVQGTNPVNMVVKSGGRFVYVLNQGTMPTGAKGCTDETTCHLHWTDSGISLFTVGGDGSLTYLQHYDSQGYDPQWVQFDTTNSFLYVLDKYSQSGDGNGSISVFSIDPTTGRLEPVQNSQSIPPGAGGVFYWEVGQTPFMMKSAGSCLFTVNSADHSITPYSQGAGGQLVNVTTGKINTSASDITSINGNGSYIILTDAGSNMIFPYQVGGTCTLNTFVGGPVANASGTSNPVNSLIDTSNKYLYILNQSSTNTTQTQAASSITAYFINTSSGLSLLTGTPTFTVDSGPVCMVEDPTNKYMYISDHTSGQVTGKIFDPNTGALSPLTRGSTFSATGLANCLALSPAVD